MMADIFPDDWPNDFAEVDCNVLEGVEKSNRVLDPLIRVKRDSNSIILTLCGKARRRSESRVIEAFSLKHNWVLDGRTIRPLPSDISSIIETVIGAIDPTDVTFPQAISLSRSNQDVLPIEMDESVLRPANVDAQEYNGKLEIEGLSADLFAYQEAGISLMNQVIKIPEG